MRRRSFQGGPGGGGPVEGTKTQLPRVAVQNLQASTWEGSMTGVTSVISQTKGISNGESEKKNMPKKKKAYQESAREGVETLQFVVSVS